MRWLCLSFLVFACPAFAGTQWQLQVPQTPFDHDGPSEVVAYTPLDKAAANWSICVAYPHLKDSYWLSVNHGMVEEAARLGVSFRLVEAGGYPNVDRQRQQMLDCVSEGADALVLGTVAFDELTDTVRQIARSIPVIAAVNDIADDGITAKVGVSWTEMGAVAGRYIAQRHPKGSTPVKVAWFPGPEGAGWVRFVERGFREAVADSAVEIAVTKYGDTGREIQVLRVEEALEEVSDLDYIVGAAPAAEAAVSLLRTRGLQDRVGIVSDYMTHAVYRGIYRGKILAAPTDFPVLQGRMAIEFAVRAIEGSLVHRHAGPVIEAVEAGASPWPQLTETLAPASFIPVFKFVSEAE
ncbi:TMAO reductase system periplasmic protein TorT [Tropicibacter alexandrii]|uniref:TMAO reductase system periplasmic protein TorT n=1 Tax=Tropicibacter alexandrii TaxID=2267683 RepID=UPI000EF492D9|nr:TMAO reductase system periplasmic protein TorT [Tropicibacter alexandrii]